MDLNKANKGKSNNKLTTEMSERVWNNITKMLDKLEADLEAQGKEASKVLPMYTGPANTTTATGS